MNRRLTDISERLASDNSSGASEMTGTVLANILAIPEPELAEIAREDWEIFAISLHHAKPTVAPVFNAANAMLLHFEREGGSSASLRAMVQKMMEEERRSGSLIAEHALRELRGDWFMTVSYSGTVKQVLLELSKTRNIKVTVAESLPGGEGRQFAHLLSSAGIETEVIHDSTIIARMEVVDAAITGADSVTPYGLVNKVGTRVLVEAARIKDRPAYAVCGWSKLSPVALSDPVVRTTVIGERSTEHVQMFENTPLELFSHLITDRGVLASADLRMELRMERVAAAWHARDALRKA